MVCQNTGAAMSHRTAQEHLFHGRLRLAALHARDALACDDGSQAAVVLLRIRLEQGWFADAVQLASERFRVALPATQADGEAALRMHLARVCAGAEAEPALRAMRAVGSFAHDGRSDAVPLRRSNGALDAGLRFSASEPIHRGGGVRAHPRAPLAVSSRGDLDVLPLVALLQRVNQPERASLLALDYLADLDERPTPERSLTLYDLSLANVSLRR